jgi:hypothetical protein
MSAGDLPFDPGVTGHAQRAEIYARLGGVEQSQAVIIARTDGMKEQIGDLREDCRRGRQEAKDDHDALDAKIDLLATQITGAKITPLQILIATSPFTVSIIALIGVIVGKGGP